jgi:hypothetical protein
MKKHIVNFLLILPVLVLISCSGSPSSEKEAQSDPAGVTSIKNPTSDEYQLDLTPHVLEYTIMGQELAQFQKKFKLRGNIPFASLSETVNFKDLIDTLIGIQKGSEGEYLSGVWVNYTLTQGDSLKYYFSTALSSSLDTSVSPVVFSYNQVLSEPDFEQVLRNNTSEIFEIINNKVVRTSSDTGLIRKATNNWRNYKTKIQIRKNSGLGWRDFQPQADSIGNDGICVYFPMQELYHLWFDNRDTSGGTEGNNVFLHVVPSSKKSFTTSGFSHYVNLFCSGSNSFSGLPRNLSDSDYLKVYEEIYGSIPKSIDNAKQDAFVQTYLFGKNNFHGMAANYGQLCPTRCKGFKVVNRKITP